MVSAGLSQWRQCGWCSRLILLRCCFVLVCWFLKCEACKIEDFPSLVSSTSGCISDVKIWMNSVRLQLNYDKTEFIIIGGKSKELPETTININGHNDSYQ